MKNAVINKNIQKYIIHALSIEAYRNEELVRKGSGAGLKIGSTPKDKCMLITNFHLLLNNDVWADKFVLKSKCSEANGRVLKYSDLNGFDILKDILIFSFKCTKQCPILKLRKSGLKNNETLHIPFHEGMKTGVMKVTYRRKRFILHRNVILIEAEGKAGEGTSGSPVIDGNGNFLGIVAGGIENGKKKKSVFIVPQEDIGSVYKADHSTSLSQKAFLNFINGYLSFSKQEHSSAIEMYEKYITIFPDDAKVYYHLGNVFHHHGIINGEIESYRKALACYNRAVELYPHFTQAIFNKGNIYYDLNRHNEAIECYNKVLKITPYYVKAYVNRGNEFVKVNKFQRALKEYTKAIQIDDSYPEAYNNRGNVYTDMRQFKKAYKDYKTALNLEPLDPDTIFNLGTYYYHYKKYKITLKHYNRAIKIKPNFIEYYLGRADLYTDIRKYRKAILDYSQALTLNDRLAIIFFKRGKCYYLMGKNREAVHDWERAILFDEKYKEELSIKIEKIKKRLESHQSAVFSSS
jgi:tetratricopeptide (TPR) repeat protein